MATVQPIGVWKLEAAISGVEDTVKALTGIKQECDAHGDLVRSKLCESLITLTMKDVAALRDAQQEVMKLIDKPTVKEAVS